MVEDESKREDDKKHHFVLVHGACHGAWCWYKLIPLLQSAGHKVTAIDLAASGARSQNLSDVHSFSDYASPLIEVMECLPHEERVILVGHSNGGIAVAMAANTYPEKVSAVVFLAAFMPDSTFPPSSPMLKYFEITPPDYFIDSQISMRREEAKVPSTILFGPKCLSKRLYQNCSNEDIALVKSLARVSAFHLDSLSNTPPLCFSKYGSVSRVYIVCDDDQAIPQGYQRSMIENYQPSEVKVIDGSDHMPMLCKPHELFLCLVEIAGSYR